MAFLAEDLHGVVAADLPDERRRPDRTHRLQNIALKRAFGVAEQHNEPLAAAF